MLRGPRNRNVRNAVLLAAGTEHDFCVKEPPFFFQRFEECLCDMAVETLESAHRVNVAESKKPHVCPIDPTAERAKGLLAIHLTAGHPPISDRDRSVLQRREEFRDLSWRRGSIRIHKHHDVSSARAHAGPHRGTLSAILWQAKEMKRKKVRKHPRDVRRPISGAIVDHHDFIERPRCLAGKRDQLFKKRRQTSPFVIGRDDQRNRHA